MKKRRLKLIGSGSLIFLQSLSFSNAINLANINRKFHNPVADENQEVIFNQENSYSLIDLFANPDVAERVLYALMNDRAIANHAYGIHTQVKLSDLAKITKLDLSGLNLTDINVLTRTKVVWEHLTSLNLNHNNFKERLIIDAKTFPKLYQLAVNSSNLTKLPNLSSFTNQVNQLRLLDFGNNKIKNLTSELSKLKLGYLNLANNQLGQEDFVIGNYKHQEPLPVFHLGKYRAAASTDGYFDVDPDQDPYLNLSGNYFKQLPKITLAHGTNLHRASDLHQNHSVQNYFYSSNGLAEFFGLKKFNVAGLKKLPFFQNLVIIQKDQTFAPDQFNKVKFNRPLTIVYDDLTHNSQVNLMVNYDFSDDLIVPSNVDDMNFSLFHQRFGGEKAGLVSSRTITKQDVLFGDNYLWDTKSPFLKQYINKLHPEQIELNYDDFNGSLTFSFEIVYDQGTSQVRKTKLSKTIRGFKQLGLKYRDHQNKLVNLSFSELKNGLITKKAPETMIRLGNQFGLTSLSNSLIANQFETNYDPISKDGLYHKLSERDIKVIAYDETLGKIYFKISPQQKKLANNLSSSPFGDNIGNVYFAWTGFSPSVIGVLGNSNYQPAWNNSINFDLLTDEQFEYFNTVLNKPVNEVTGDDLFKLKAISTNRSDMYKNVESFNKNLRINADLTQRLLNWELSLPGNQATNLKPITLSVNWNFDQLKAQLSSYQRFSINNQLRKGIKKQLHNATDSVMPKHLTAVVELQPSTGTSFNLNQIIPSSLDLNYFKKLFNPRVVDQPQTIVQVIGLSDANDELGTINVAYQLLSKDGQVVNKNQVLQGLATANAITNYLSFHQDQFNWASESLPEVIDLNNVANLLHLTPFPTNYLGSSGLNIIPIKLVDYGNKLALSYQLQITINNQSFTSQIKLTDLVHPNNDEKLAMTARLNHFLSIISVSPVGDYHKLLPSEFLQKIIDPQAFPSHQGLLTGQAFTLTKQAAFVKNFSFNHQPQHTKIVPSALFFDDLVGEIHFDYQLATNDGQKPVYSTIRSVVLTGFDGYRQRMKRVVPLLQPLPNPPTLLIDNHNWKRYLNPTNQYLNHPGLDLNLALNSIDPGHQIKLAISAQGLNYTQEYDYPWPEHWQQPSTLSTKTNKNTISFSNILSNWVQVHQELEPITPKKRLKRQQRQTTVTSISHNRSRRYVDNSPVGVSMDTETYNSNGLKDVVIGFYWKNWARTSGISAAHLNQDNLLDYVQYYVGGNPIPDNSQAYVPLILHIETEPNTEFADASLQKPIIYFKVLDKDSGMLSELRKKTVDDYRSSYPRTPFAIDQINPTGMVKNPEQSAKTWPHLITTNNWDQYIRLIIPQSPGWPGVDVDVTSVNGDDQTGQVTLTYNLKFGGLNPNNTELDPQQTVSTQRTSTISGFRSFQLETEQAVVHAKVKNNNPSPLQQYYPNQINANNIKNYFDFIPDFSPDLNLKPLRPKRSNSGNNLQNDHYSVNILQVIGDNQTGTVYVKYQLICHLQNQNLNHATTKWLEIGGWKETTAVSSDPQQNDLNHKYQNYANSWELLRKRQKSAQPNLNQIYPSQVQLPNDPKGPDQYLLNELFNYQEYDQQQQLQVDVLSLNPNDYNGTLEVVYQVHAETANRHNLITQNPYDTQAVYSRVFTKIVSGFKKLDVTIAVNNANQLLSNDTPLTTNRSDILPSELLGANNKANSKEVPTIFQAINQLPHLDGAHYVLEQATANDQSGTMTITFQIRPNHGVSLTDTQLNIFNQSYTKTVSGFAALNIHEAQATWTLNPSLVDRIGIDAITNEDQLALYTYPPHLSKPDQSVIINSLVSKQETDTIEIHYQTQALPLVNQQLFTNDLPSNLVNLTIDQTRVKLLPSYFNPKKKVLVLNFTGWKQADLERWFGLIKAGQNIKTPKINKQMLQGPKAFNLAFTKPWATKIADLISQILDQYHVDPMDLAGISFGHIRTVDGKDAYLNQANDNGNNQYWTLGNFDNDQDETQANIQRSRFFNTTNKQILLSRLDEALIWAVKKHENQIQTENITLNQIPSSSLWTSKQQIATLTGFKRSHSVNVISASWTVNDQGRAMSVNGVNLSNFTSLTNDPVYQGIQNKSHPELTTQIYAVTRIPEQNDQVRVIYAIVQNQQQNSSAASKIVFPLQVAEVSGFLPPDQYTKLTIANKANAQLKSILPSELTTANLKDYFNLTLEHGSLAEYHLVGANDPSGTVRLAYTLRDDFGQILPAQMQTLTGFKTLADALSEIEIGARVKDQYAEKILPYKINQTNYTTYLDLIYTHLPPGLSASDIHLEVISVTPNDQQGSLSIQYKIKVENQVHITDNVPAGKATKTFTLSPDQLAQPTPLLDFTIDQNLSHKIVRNGNSYVQVKFVHYNDKDLQDVLTYLYYLWSDRNTKAQATAKLGQLQTSILSYINNNTNNPNNFNKNRIAKIALTSSVYLPWDQQGDPFGDQSLMNSIFVWSIPKGTQKYNTTKPSHLTKSGFIKINSLEYFPLYSWGVLSTKFDQWKTQLDPSHTSAHSTTTYQSSLFAKGYVDNIVSPRTQNLVVVKGLLDAQTALANVTFQWSVKNDQIENVDPSSITSQNYQNYFDSNIYPTIGLEPFKADNQPTIQVTKVDGNNTTGEVNLTYQISYTPTQGSAITTPTRVVKLSVIKDNFDQENATLATVTVNFSGKGDFNNSLPSIIKLPTDPNSNFDTYINVDTSPLTSNQHNINYQVIGLIADDQNGTLKIIYLLKKAGKLWHPFQAQKIKTTTIQGFQTRDKSFHQLVDQKLNSVQLTAKPEAAQIYPQSLVGTRPNTLSPREQQLVEKYLTLTGVNDQEYEVHVQKVSGNNITGQLTVTFKLAHKSAPDLESTTTKEVVVDNFLTYQKDVNQATFTFSPNEQGVDKYPTTINANNAPTFLIHRTNKNLVDHTNNHQVRIKAIENPDDENGTLTVKYQVVLTVGANSYTSTEQSSVVNGLFTYQKDLDQTTQTWSVKPGQEINNIAPSTITDSNITTYLQNQASGNTKTDGISPEILTLSPDNDQGKLYITYRNTLTTSSNKKITSTVNKSAVVTGFGSNATSFNNHAILTFALTPLGQKTLPNDVETHNWNRLITFTSSDHVSQPTEVSFTAKDDKTGSLKIQYKLINANGVVSSNKIETDINGFFTWKKEADSLNAVWKLSTIADNQQQNNYPSAYKTSFDNDQNAVKPKWQTPWLYTNNQLHSDWHQTELLAIESTDDAAGTMTIKYQVKAGRDENNFDTSDEKSLVISGFLSYQKDNENATLKPFNPAISLANIVPSNVLKPDNDPASTTPSTIATGRDKKKWNELFKNEDYENLKLQNRSQIKYEIIRLVPDDFAGNLTVIYKTILTPTGQAKLTSNEKIMVIDGFKTKKDTTYDFLAALTPSWTNTQADRTNVQPKDINKFDDPNTQTPNSLYHYVSFAPGNKPADQKYQNLEINNVSASVTGLISNNQDGSVTILYDLKYTDNNSQPNVVKVFKTQKIDGFKNQDQIRQAELEKARLSFSKLNNNQKFYASSLFANKTSFNNQNQTDVQKIRGALEIRNLPDQSDVNITNATVDNVQGSMTLTYEIVSRVPGSNNQELKSQAKTVTVSGFLTFKDDFAAANNNWTVPIAAHSKYLSGLSDVNKQDFITDWAQPNNLTTIADSSVFTLNPTYEIKSIIPNDQDGSAIVTYVIKIAVTNGPGIPVGSASTNFSINRTVRFGSGTFLSYQDDLNRASVSWTGQRLDTILPSYINQSSLTNYLTSTIADNVSQLMTVQVNAVQADDINGRLTINYQTKITDAKNQTYLSVPKTATVNGFDAIAARADRVLVSPVRTAVTHTFLPSELTPVNLFNAFSFQISNPGYEMIDPAIIAANDHLGTAILSYRIKSLGSAYATSYRKTKLTGLSIRQLDLNQTKIQFNPNEKTGLSFASGVTEQNIQTTISNYPNPNYLNNHTDQNKIHVVLENQGLQGDDQTGVLTINFHLETQNEIFPLLKGETLPANGTMRNQKEWFWPTNLDQLSVNKFISTKVVSATNTTIRIKLTNWNDDQFRLLLSYLKFNPNDPKRNEWLTKLDQVISEYINDDSDVQGDKNQYLKNTISLEFFHPANSQYHQPTTPISTEDKNNKKELADQAIKTYLEAAINDQQNDQFWISNDDNPAYLQAYDLDKISSKPLQVQIKGYLTVQTDLNNTIASWDLADDPNPQPANSTGKKAQNLEAKDVTKSNINDYLATVHYVNNKSNANDLSYEFQAVSATDDNNDIGVVSVTYVINRTVNGQKYTSDPKTTWIGGWKIPTYDANAKFTPKGNFAKTKPSDVRLPTENNSNWNDLIEQAAPNDYQISINQIIPNDVDGSLVIVYTLQHKTKTSVRLIKMTQPITGFEDLTQQEQARLEAIEVNDISVKRRDHNNKFLASTLFSDGNSLTDQEKTKILLDLQFSDLDHAIPIISNVTADDDTGALTINFKLQSTNGARNVIESTKVFTKKITNYQTLQDAVDQLEFSFFVNEKGAQLYPADNHDSNGKKIDQNNLKNYLNHLPTTAALGPNYHNIDFVFSDLQGDNEHGKLTFSYQPFIIKQDGSKITASNKKTITNLSGFFSYSADLNQIELNQPSLKTGELKQTQPSTITKDNFAQKFQTPTFNNHVWNNTSQINYEIIKVIPDDVNGILQVLYTLSLTPDSNNQATKFVSPIKVLLITMNSVRDKMDQFTVTFNLQPKETLAAPNLFNPYDLTTKFTLTITNQQNQPQTSSQYRVINPRVASYDLIQGTVTVDYQIVNQEGVVSNVKTTTISGFKTAKTMLNELVQRYQLHPEAYQKLLPSLNPGIGGDLSTYLTNNHEPLFNPWSVYTPKGIHAELVSIGYHDNDTTYINPTPNQKNATGCLNLRYKLTAEIFVPSDSGTQKSWIWPTAPIALGLDYQRLEVNNNLVTPRFQGWSNEMLLNLFAYLSHNVNTITEQTQVGLWTKQLAYQLHELLTTNTKLWAKHQQIQFKLGLTTSGQQLLLTVAKNADVQAIQQALTQLLSDQQHDLVANNANPAYVLGTYQKVESDVQTKTVQGYATISEFLAAADHDAYWTKLQEYQNLKPSQIKKEQIKNTPYLDDYFAKHWQLPQEISPRLEITSLVPNDQLGQLTIRYVIKGNPRTKKYLVKKGTNEVTESNETLAEVSTEEHQFVLFGFKTDDQERSSSLDQMNLTFTPKDNSIIPSEISKSNFDNYITTTGLDYNSLHPIKTIIQLEPDDHNGTLTVYYVIKDNQASSLVKKTQISGFSTIDQKEMVRLNAALDRVQVTVRPGFDRNQYPTTAAGLANPSGYYDKLASQLMTTNLPEDSQLVVTSVTCDNASGTLNYEYGLISTKPGVKPQKGTTKSSSISGMLTYQKDIDQAQVSLAVMDDLVLQLYPSALKNSLKINFRGQEIDLSKVLTVPNFHTKDQDPTHVKSIEIKEQSDPDDTIGQITITYVIKMQVNNQVFTSIAKKGILSGFLTEQDDVDHDYLTFMLKNNPNHYDNQRASSWLDINKFKKNLAVNYPKWNEEMGKYAVPAKNYQYQIKKIVPGYPSGKLYVFYVTQIRRPDGTIVTSREWKQAEVSGFKTDQSIVDQVNISNFQPKPNIRLPLPSELNADNFFSVFEIQSNPSGYTIINPLFVNPDDDQGTVQISYHVFDPTTGLSSTHTKTSQLQNLATNSQLSDEANKIDWNLFNPNHFAGVVKSNNFYDYITPENLPSWVRPTNLTMTDYNVPEGTLTFSYEVVRGKNKYSATKTINGFLTKPLTMKLISPLVSAQTTPTNTLNVLNTLSWLPGPQNHDTRYVISKDGALKDIGINQVNLDWLYQNDWLYPKELLAFYGVDQTNLSDYFINFKQNKLTGVISFQVQLPEQKQFKLPAINQSFSFSHWFHFHSTWKDQLITTEAHTTQVNKTLLESFTKAPIVFAFWLSQLDFGIDPVQEKMLLVNDQNFIVKLQSLKNIKAISRSIYDTGRYLIDLEKIKIDEKTSQIILKPGALIAHGYYQYGERVNQDYVLDKELHLPIGHTITLTTRIVESQLKALISGLVLTGILLLSLLLMIMLLLATKAKKERHQLQLQLYKVKK